MLDPTKDSEPPLVEMVLGVQFSPLTKLTAGHFGLFWKELGDDWSTPGDGVPLEDQFEQFERPQWDQPRGFSFKLEPMRFPGRFTVAHRSQGRQLQIQSTQLHLNWRKQDDADPRYHQLIDEFENLYGRFCDFAAGADLGTISPNQWIITHVNAFSQESDWQTPLDWSDLMPGFFGSPKSAAGLELEHRAAEWSYTITSKRGRHHIAARTNP